MKRTVGECAKAGLVEGERVRVDATLIRSEVSRESLVEERVERVMVERREEAEASGERESELRRRLGRSRSRPAQRRRRSETDLEATTAM